MKRLQLLLGLGAVVAAVAACALAFPLFGAKHLLAYIFTTVPIFGAVAAGLVDVQQIPLYDRVIIAAATLTRVAPEASWPVHVARFAGSAVCPNRLTNRLST